MTSAERWLEAARWTVPVAAVLLLTVALAGLLYVAAELLLLLFVGVLLAVLLRAVMAPLERLRLPRALAFGLSLLLMLLLFALALWFFVPLLVSGVQELAERLPQAAERLGEQLRNRLPVEDAVSGVFGGEGGGLLAQTLARLMGVFSTVMGAGVAALVILFTGLYLAAEPEAYRGGLLRLVPPAARPRARALLDELGHMLGWWLFGQFISMATVGVLTWIGLVSLGVPLAGTLALIAVLLSFIPTIGPILSAVPAIIVAFTQDLWLAAYVVLLYVVVQSVESYLVTPLVQRRVVHLPPVLVLAAQLLMAVLYGVLGLLVAAPLAVVVMILVKRLYVEAALGDTVE